MSVSLFASSVRPQLYELLFKSLEGTTVDYEVVFAGKLKGCGDMNECELCELESKYNMRYIVTENIKPAQCYEIARRHCNMETVVWIADDCEFPNDVIGKAYRYWKEQNNRKLILSIQTKESGYGLPQGKLFDMTVHRFFAGRSSTPLMAPLGMMSRKYLEELGGIDRRYVCGQYENDIVMRTLVDGGKVEIFGGADAYIDIDHLGKSKLVGESKTDIDFLKRPFAKGYHKDRRVLESSWTKNGRVTMERNDQFEPFEDIDLLTKSQSNKGIWE